MAIGVLLARAVGEVAAVGVGGCVGVEHPAMRTASKTAATANLLDAAHRFLRAVIADALPLCCCNLGLDKWDEAFRPTPFSTSLFARAAQAVSSRPTIPRSDSVTNMGLDLW